MPVVSTPRPHVSSPNCRHVSRSFSSTLLVFTVEHLQNALAKEQLKSTCLFSCTQHPNQKNHIQTQLDGLEPSVKRRHSSSLLFSSISGLHALHFANQQINMSQIWSKISQSTIKITNLTAAPLPTNDQLATHSLYQGASTTDRQARGFNFNVERLACRL